MGIRYYAYPVDAELIDLARASPRAFLSSDPLADAWGLAAERPPMLYLDKCWWELQRLFSARPGEVERPAAGLVRGRVREHSNGWDAFLRVLDPAEVAHVAADLALFGEADVRAMFEQSPQSESSRDPDAEIRYVVEYLADATAFVTDLARTGRGMIYLIG